MPGDRLLSEYTFLIIQRCQNIKAFTTEDTEGTEKGQIKGLGFGLICGEHENQRPIALLVLKSKA
jgi:hypothetical protein